MIRYILSDAANEDLAELRAYLVQLPLNPGNRIASDIKGTLRKIAANPYQGRAQSELTRYSGQEIRSWLIGSYRIYYRLGRTYPEIIAVLHTARDHTSILRQRIQ